MAYGKRTYARKAKKTMSRRAVTRRWLPAIRKPVYKPRRVIRKRRISKYKRY